VKGDLRRAARFLTLPTLGLVFVVAFVPGRLELAIRVYALVLCGATLLLVLAVLRRAYPASAPLRPRQPRRPERPRPPVPLARVEQEVALGVASSFDLHYRLRPRLRELALARLAAHRRIALDDESEVAREILGDETFELVRRDRPPPEDRLARGLPPAAVRRVVESLERL